MSAGGFEAVEAKTSVSSNGDALKLKASKGIFIKHCFIMNHPVSMSYPDFPIPTIKFEAPIEI